MALREANYVFTRRIADRGNEKIVFDSQDRKIQETDSKDVIWDEIVGKEEHPEDCDGYKFQETDSEAFIRDENCGKEEHPGNCSVIYPSPPCFDDYEDEEWYFWVTGRNRNLTDDESGSKICNVEDVVVGAETGPSMGLNGKSVNKEMTECTKVPAAIFVDLFYGDEIIIGGGAVSSGGELQSVVSTCGDVPYLEVPIFQPPTKEILNFEVHKISSPTNLGFQIDGDLAELNNGINIQIEENILVAIDKDNFGGSEGCMQDNGTRGPDNSSSLRGKIKDVHVGNITIQQGPLIIPKGGPHKIGENVSFEANNEDPHGFVDENQRTQNKPIDGPCDSGDQHAKNRHGPHMNKNYGPSFEFIQSKTLVVHKMFEWVKSIVNNHAPFDPGGTSPEPDETTREVEQFRRVVIIA